MEKLKAMLATMKEEIEESEKDLEKMESRGKPINTAIVRIRKRMMSLGRNSKTARQLAQELRAGG